MEAAEQVDEMDKKKTWLVRDVGVKAGQILLGINLWIWKRGGFLCGFPYVIAQLLWGNMRSQSLTVTEDDMSLPLCGFKDIVTA